MIWLRKEYKRANDTKPCLKLSFSSCVEDENIKSGDLIGKFKGKRISQQKEFIGGNYFKFVSFPGPLIAGYTFNFNREIRFFSKKLAERLEPSCLEISVMNYVLARKSTKEHFYTYYHNK